MPASLAFFTVDAMACESTASSRMTLTFSSIIRCIWSACWLASASALAYSTFPFLWVSSDTLLLMIG